MPSVILRKLSVEQSSTQEGTEETPLVNRRRFFVGWRLAQDRARERRAGGYQGACGGLPHALGESTSRARSQESPTHDALTAAGSR